MFGRVVACSAVLAAGLIGLTASEAWGGPPTSVSNVSVSPLSTASGATTNWTIGFKTSSSGALAYPGAIVTIVLPTGSSLGSFEGGTLTDTTTGNGLSSDCYNTTGTTLECDFNYGYSANAGDVLSLVLTDVTNPTSTGSATTTVSTSSDTQGVSKTVTITAAKGISNLSVSPSSTAAGATTNWTIGFTTSSTGALGYPGAFVTVVLPAGSSFGSFEGGTLTDTTTGNGLSSDCYSTTGTTLECDFNYGNFANAGDVLSLVLTDVTNPASTGSASTTVSTSSDTQGVSKSVTITAAKPVSNMSVSLVSTVAGATTNWTIGFTTSSTGALTYPGASVTVVLPAGTSLASFEGGTLTDTTTSNGLSSDCYSTTGTTLVCAFNYGNPAHAGDVLSLVLTDVTNPTTTGSVTTSVSTSSDTQPASKSVTLTAAQAVSNLSVSPSSTAAGATTNWTIGFTTSSTGALGYPGAFVTVVLPAGSSFGSFEGGTLTDTTTGNGLSSDCYSTTGTTLECDFNDGNSANAGDVLSLVLTDLTNPTSTGSATTTVSTSSDTQSASKSVTITAAQAVSSVSVTPTVASAGSEANWTIGFTTSSTGGLTYPGGSVTVTLPTGTGLSSFGGGMLTDTTTGDGLSSDCYRTTGTTLVCAFNYRKPGERRRCAFAGAHRRDEPSEHWHGYDHGDHQCRHGAGDRVLHGHRSFRPGVREAGGHYLRHGHAVEMHPEERVVRNGGWEGFGPDLDGHVYVEPEQEDDQGQRHDQLTWSGVLRFRKHRAGHRRHDHRRYREEVHGNGRRRAGPDVPERNRQAHPGLGDSGHLLRSSTSTRGVSWPGGEGAVSV